VKLKREFFKSKLQGQSPEPSPHCAEQVWFSA